MRAHVTSQQRNEARNVSLLQFLTVTSPRSFEIIPGTESCRYTGQSVRTPYGMATYFPDVIAPQNAIDFLMQYLGYDFVHAVKELNRFARDYPDAVMKPKRSDSPRGNSTVSGEPGSDAASAFILPTKTTPPFRRIFGFLTHRGIPYNTVKYMVRHGMLYESAAGHAVFVNQNQDYYEEMSTISYSQFPYYEFASQQPQAFWSIRNSNEAASRICICSTALDAVSLMVLHHNAGISTSTVYASVGKTAYTDAMERLRQEAIHLSCSAFLAGSFPDTMYLPNRDCYGTMKPLTASWSQDLASGLTFSEPHIHS